MNGVRMGRKSRQTGPSSTEKVTTTTSFITGDCLQVVPTLGRFDVIVTSPPYNLGIPYGAYDDNRPRAQYLAWMAEVVAMLRDALAPDGSLFWVFGTAPRDPWLELDVLSLFRSSFRLQNRIVWAKSVTVSGRTFGQFKPSPGRRFLSGTFETIYHLTRAGNVPLDRLAAGVPYTAEPNAEKWGGGSNVRCGGNVWHVPYEPRANRRPKLGLSPDLEDSPDWLTITEAARRAGVLKSMVVTAVERKKLIDNGLPRHRRRICGASLRAWLRHRAEPRNVHPAAFPSALAERCIRLHGVRPGLRVLDPFAGEGNTLRACERLGVVGVGVEIDPRYAPARSPSSEPCH
jgi:DNA modification methylase